MGGLGPDGRADPTNNCTASVRPVLSVRNRAGTSPPLDGTSPPMEGDAGLDESPAILSIVGEDPDLGDVAVDVMHLLRAGAPRPLLALLEARAHVEPM